MHASVELFFAAVVFGAGFHLAGAVLDFISSLIEARRRKS